MKLLNKVRKIEKMIAIMVVIIVTIMIIIIIIIIITTVIIVIRKAMKTRIIYASVRSDYQR